MPCKSEYKATPYFSNEKIKKVFFDKTECIVAYKPVAKL
jgi:hypothetical protein